MRAQEFLSEARIPDEIEDFLYDLTPEDVGVEEFGPYRVHYEGFTDDCQSSADYCANPEAVYQQVFADHIAREGGRRPIEQNFTGDEDYPILYSIFKIPRPVKERAERARDAIENIVTMDNINDYFVRFTDVDKLGYSAQQDFGRMPDVGDADWDPDALPKKKGHPALWFYPASYYLKHKDLFADSRPYVWLVKRRPNAYLQPTKGATQPEVPPGMVRAGLMHKESGVPVAVFFRPEFDVVDRWHEPRQIKEAFNQPYPVKWEKSEHGDYDALAKLDDGTFLSIMFNNEGDDEWQVEFHRNNSQEVTGEGDAHRIFATVLTAIQQFIQKEHPWRVIFSASKDVEPGQNSQSRAKLYNSLIARYARAWGYDEYNEDHGDQITYELTRLKPSVAENFADGKVKGKSRPGRVKKAGASCAGSVSSLRAKAKKYGGERGKMYHWCANMKGGKKKANEMITVPTVSKGKREHLDVMPNDGRRIPPGQESDYMGEQVGRLGNVEVWMYRQGPLRTFVTFDPETRISQLAVTGSRYPENPDSFVVKGVYSGPKNTTRAADLYAWLVRELGLTLVSDRKQSPGGLSVWQELERRYSRSINIYAYNMRTNEPVNTGTDDPESTHGRRGDIAQNVRLIATPK